MNLADEIWAPLEIVEPLVEFVLPAALEYQATAYAAAALPLTEC